MNGEKFERLVLLFSASVALGSSLFPLVLYCLFRLVDSRHIVFLFETKFMYFTPNLCTCDVNVYERYTKLR
jgi:hypothetical protein